MVDGKGRDLESIGLIDEPLRFRHCEGQGDRACRLRRSNHGAMVRCAVAIVGGIGSVEASDHGFETLGTVNGKRRGVAAPGPAQQHHGTEAVDVIRMIMGQEQSADLAIGQPHHRDVACPAFSCIDHKHLVARDEEGARAGAITAGQR